MRAFLYLLVFLVFAGCQKKGDGASSSEEIDLGNFESYITLDNKKNSLGNVDAEFFKNWYTGFNTQGGEISLRGNMFSGEVGEPLVEAEEFTLVKAETGEFYLAEKYHEPSVGLEFLYSTGDDIIKETFYMAGGNGEKASFQKARVNTTDNSITPNGILLGYLLSFENVKFIPFTSEEIRGQLKWTIIPNGKPINVSGKIFIRDPERTRQQKKNNQ